MTTNNNPDNAYQEYAVLDHALAKDDAITAQKTTVKLVSALKDIPGSGDAAKAATAII